MLRARESLTVKQVARYRMLKASGPTTPARQGSERLTAPEPEKQSLLRRVAEVVIRLQSVVEEIGDLEWHNTDTASLREAVREGVGLFQSVEALIAERRVAR